jgi:ribosomal protein L11 methyltransferase
LGSYPALDVTLGESVTSDLEDRLLGTLDDFSPLAVQEREAGDGWRIFFSTPTERDGAARALREEPDLALRIASIDVPDEDWARRSQASLTAIRIGRLIVAPPWDNPRTNAAATLTAESGDLVIEIDPSMGFGTGHHATTRLCLGLLQRQRLREARVLDIGTGSGVLAIAASLLGANEVLAIDHDADALQNARDNIDRNHARVLVRHVDLEAIENDRFDLVIANLTAAAITRHAHTLSALVQPGGVLILSGFSPDDVRDVAEALGVEPIENAIEGDWAAMLVERG